MSTELVNRKSEVMALQLRHTTALDPTRQIEFVTAIAADADVKELDAFLDKLARASDRQQAYYKWRELNEKLADLVDILLRYESDLVTAGEMARIRWEGGGRKGEWDPEKHLSGNEKQHKIAVEASIAKERARGKLLQEDIAKLEARYGFRASDIGADRGTGNADRQVSGYDLAGGAAS